MHTQCHLGTVTAKEEAVRKTNIQEFGIRNDKKIYVSGTKKQKKPPFSVKKHVKSKNNCFPGHPSNLQKQKQLFL
jgi:hypothetical protein